MKCHNKVWYFCRKNIFTLQGRCQRWIPVFLVIFTIIASYLIFNFLILEVVTKTYIRKQIDIVFVSFFFIMYLWSFFQAVITKNKEIPKIYKFSSEVNELYQISSTPINFDEITTEHVLHHDLPIYNRLGNGGFRYCYRCMIVKPDRTHHCSNCNKCIIKFDHHCPWINNCVMFTNYKYFLLFLIYGTLLHLSLTVNNIESIIDFASNNGTIIYRHVHSTIIICFVINFILNFGSLGAILSMLLWHLTLVGRNLTTNESYRPPLFTYGIDKKAYNISLKYNFSEVFGSKMLLWFLPIWSSKGDGITFKQKVYFTDDKSNVEKKNKKEENNLTSNSTITLDSSNNIDYKCLKEKKIDNRIENMECDETQSTSYISENITKVTSNNKNRSTQI
ncbi:Zinc finger, DHHC-type, palmitoyltransferase domain-containing protein [Strongyloides ratti]|uniref:Palmitoyltransferase n=1 Tax=Strongyloides ratti TaxID=34506 RepID=A0A090L556_STRRB|nr:Zinc finger, DHHC-type, palmitoyltransferase domain-containing protein [Strongyloides ratti]CEF64857.1 Zinc finger, DHHC-type, palmitoyltransferase domain-containing protein [Strongyloides ratti]